MEEADTFNEEDSAYSEVNFSRIKILIDLHRNNKWHEALMGELFSYVYDRVLTPTERIIVDEKVKGSTNGEIAVVLKTEPSTIRRHVYSIKKKYRNQMRSRVDHYR